MSAFEAAAKGRKDPARLHELGHHRDDVARRKLQIVCSPLNSQPWSPSQNPAGLVCCWAGLGWAGLLLGWAGLGLAGLGWAAGLGWDAVLLLDVVIGRTYTQK